MRSAAGRASRMPPSSGQHDARVRILAKAIVPTGIGNLWLRLRKPVPVLHSQRHSLLQVSLVRWRTIRV